MELRVGYHAEYRCDLTRPRVILAQLPDTRTELSGIRVRVHGIPLAFREEFRRACENIIRITFGITCILSQHPGYPLEYR